MAKNLTNIANNAVTDINLSVTAKKRFRINGNDDSILELNTSDMNILVRLKEAHPKLEALVQKLDTFDNLAQTESEDELEDLFTMGTLFKDIDTEMRALLDFIFDSNVSEVCAPSGSMYDIFNGEFRFEHIINALMDLYETNITQEYKNMSNRVKKHTKKYVKK